MATQTAESTTSAAFVDTQAQERVRRELAAILNQDPVLSVKTFQKVFTSGYFWFAMGVLGLMATILALNSPAT
jgi:hypothetical protein